MLGPIYGASLTALWSWHLIFLVNIPLCVILMAVTWFLLKPGLGYAATAAFGHPPSSGTLHQWGEKVDYDMVFPVRGENRGTRSSIPAAAQR